MREQLRNGLRRKAQQSPVIILNMKGKCKDSYLYPQFVTVECIRSGLLTTSQRWRLLLQADLQPIRPLQNNMFFWAVDALWDISGLSFNLSPIHQLWLISNRVLTEFYLRTHQRTALFQLTQTHKPSASPCCWNGCEFIYDPNKCPVMFNIVKPSVPICFIGHHTS